MTDTIYTAVTFAPVQGFIEKSRKLRDLYGSSYLLSLLAQSVCTAADSAGCTVVSPALPNITQGMPNQIILRGVLPKAEAEQWFFKTWESITDVCRQWVVDEVKGDWNYYWNRDWSLWANHTWEFFHVIGQAGETVTQVRQRLNEAKRSRAWTGINWQGESSTLSGTDAVAWAELGKIAKPSEQAAPWSKGVDQKSPIERFYEALSRQLGASFIRETPVLCKRYSGDSQKFGEKSIEYGAAFIDPDEELSIPELTKRLITHKAVVKKLMARVGELPHLIALERQLEKDLNPECFTDLNRLQHKRSNEPQYWTGWFQGDGDGASDYLKWLGEQNTALEEDEGTTVFSTEMRRWGEALKSKEEECLPNGNGRIIYAGGDDFLGVLYKPKAQLEPKECLKWFSTFSSEVWHGLQLEDPEHPESFALLSGANSSPKKITASVGFVWVSPKVPQRDVLQHCREAEQSAKRKGKDRIAFRIVFSGGNYLEWVCPWWVLESGLFEQYRDRNGTQGLSSNANWAHLYNDVAVLESRHAFGATGAEQFAVAQALFHVYFGQDNPLLDESHWWNQKNEYKKVIKAGVLGDREHFEKDGSLDHQKVTKALNDWVINLAKVGFHLCSDT